MMEGRIFPRSPSPSQKVRRGRPLGDDPLRVRDGFEQLRLSLVDVLKVQDGGDVAASVAVVGRGPDRHHLVVEHVLVALVDELVGAANEFEVVEMNEFGGDFRSEEPARAPRTRRPRVHVFRIRPDQIAEGALVRDLLVPLDRSNLVQRLDVRRKAAVNAEDLIVYDGGNGEKVEDFAAMTPRIGVAIFVLTLVVKAVNLRDLSALVVAAKQCNFVGPSGFEQEQSGKRLEAVVAAIHEVAHEDVVGVGDLAASPEELFQVVELAVNVAADGDGREDRLHIRLLQEQVTNDIAESLQLVFRQVIALFRNLDPLVNVEVHHILFFL